MLKVDFHVHSLASFHALHSVEELLGHADRKGLDGIAVTDHCPGMDNTLWLVRNSQEEASWQHRIKSSDLPHFSTFVNRYHPPDRFRVKLFKGIECNILGEGELAVDVPLGLAAGFDLIIASIHPLKWLFQVHDRKQITQRILKAMDAPVDVIGHPVHKGLCPDFDPIAQKAAEKGIAIEVNCSSFALRRADLKEFEKMCEAVEKHGCKISLGSDAHMSNELGEDEVLKGIFDPEGAQKEWVVNADLASAKAFVEQRKQIRKRWLVEWSGS